MNNTTHTDPATDREAFLIEDSQLEKKIAATKKSLQATRLRLERYATNPPRWF